MTVSKKYLAKFTNKRVLNIIEDIPRSKLKELAESYREQLRELNTKREQNQPIPYPFKKRLLAGELPFLLKKMKRSVDRFLEIEDALPCSIRHFTNTYNFGPRGVAGGEYFPEEELIQVTRNTDAQLRWVVAHEYAHHIQYSSADCSPLFLNQVHYTIFLEGHADGVAKHVSQHHALRHHLPTLALEPLQRMLDGLNHPLSTDSHDLGNIFFAYLEQKDGPGIYKAMLHGEYDW